MKIAASLTLTLYLVPGRMWSLLSNSNESMYLVYVPRVRQCAAILRNLRGLRTRNSTTQCSMQRLVNFVEWITKTRAILHYCRSCTTKIKFDSVNPFPHHQWCAPRIQALWTWYSTKLAQGRLPNSADIIFPRGWEIYERKWVIVPESLSSLILNSKYSPPMLYM